jgi:hypothetical protein
MGTLRYEGVEYPDGRESDPEAEGWMRGSPPPPERRIRYADDTFLQFPQNRWALSHFRELMPTVAVWRGTEPCDELPPAAGPAASAIDALAFRDRAPAARLLLDHQILRRHSRGSADQRRRAG